MTDDLRATIARLKPLLDKATPGPWIAEGAQGISHIVVLDEEKGSTYGLVAKAYDHDASLIAALRNAAKDLIDAAERAQAMHYAEARRIRNAALEEAARVAEAVDPEKPTTWLHPRHKIAFAIRALKEQASG